MATYQQLFNLCKKKFNISWLYGQSHANEKLFLTEKAKQYPTPVSYTHLTLPTILLV